MNQSKLSDLIDHTDPQSILAEVRATLTDAFPEMPLDPITAAFEDIVALY